MNRLRTVRSKIILLLVVGLSGILANAWVGRYTENIKNTQFDLTRNSQSINVQVLDSLRLEQKIINRRDAEVVQSLRTAEDELQASINRLKGQVAAPEFQMLVEKLESAQERHRKMFEQISENLARLDAARNRMAEVSGKVAGGLSQIVDAITMESTELMVNGEELSVEKAAFRDLVKDLLVSINLKTLNLQNLFVLADAENYKAQLQILDKRLGQDRQNLHNASISKAVAEFKEAWTEVATLLDENNKLESTLFSEWELNGKLSVELQQAVDAVGVQASAITRLSAATAARFDRLGRWTTFGVIALVGVLFLVIGGLSVRAIQRSLKQAIDEVDRASIQIAAAAEQLEEASSRLASGASEQASSLEETSASLEEMAAMTRQNASNAGEAKAMMGEVAQTVEKMDRHMQNMSSSIGEITRTSEETGHIIKTIDEIAFQTNLLALNAAVEAARAGQAGAGFAVVADEVRNLAIRAADAAKNTAELIQSTIQAVRSGREQAQSTQAIFRENAEISNKVGALVTEIAAASQEQAQGIAQVNVAVVEIDKVTQETAASAEESASASAEMSSQAQQLKMIVSELMRLVEGGQKQENSKNKEASTKLLNNGKVRMALSGA